MAKQSNTKVSSGDEVAVAINNQLQHTPTLQVPDFLSLSKKELTAQLHAYSKIPRKNCTECTLHHRTCVFESPSHHQCTQCINNKLTCLFKFSGESSLSFLSLVSNTVAARLDFNNHKKI